MAYNTSPDTSFDDTVANYAPVVGGLVGAIGGGLVGGFAGGIPGAIAGIGAGMGAGGAAGQLLALPFRSDSAGKQDAYTQDELEREAQLQAANQMISHFLP